MKVTVLVNFLGEFENRFSLSSDAIPISLIPFSDTRCSVEYFASLEQEWLVLS